MADGYAHANPNPDAHADAYYSYSCAYGSICPNASSDTYPYTHPDADASTCSVADTAANS